MLTSFNKTREECDMQGLMCNAVLHPFAATMTDAVQQNWFWRIINLADGYHVQGGYLVYRENTVYIARTFEFLIICYLSFSWQILFMLVFPPWRIYQRMKEHSDNIDKFVFQRTFCQRKKIVCHVYLQLVCSIFSTCASNSGIWLICNHC